VTHDLHDIERFFAADSHEAGLDEYPDRTDAR
jgi:hypothetical protein